ncbi:abortive infection protein [Enterococcus florum]|uniref:Abortive infection protein n=1 Tax=Enterococcus florum TaxID=2480627 RepID=A0A4P5PCT2_9ENTE|nr:type II CAAX endopeptidase family protein [Enterococcus florum]GCF95666.1 abortive infection protein [Enterococcus florum]
MKNRSFFKRLNGYAAFLGRILVVMIVYGIAAVVYEEVLIVSEKLPSIIAVTLAVFAQLFICLMGFFWGARDEKKTLKSYGIYWQPQDWSKLLLGLGMGAAAILVICVPLYASGIFHISPGQAGSEKMAVQFIFFTGVGVIEECLCRGFLLHSFIRWGSLLALVVSSALFSLLHLGNPGISALAILNLFLAGIFMGAAMQAANSIFTAIGVHITWNWVQGAVLGIPVSGTNSLGYFLTESANAQPLFTGGTFGVEGSIICTMGLTLFSAGLLISMRRSGKKLFLQED